MSEPMTTHQPESEGRAVTTIPVAVEAPPEHGTYRAYQRPCRCKECRDANTAYQRQWRATKTGLPPDDPRHGTATGYDDYRCRCAECTEAKRIQPLRRLIDGLAFRGYPPTDDPIGQALRIIDTIRPAKARTL